MPDEGCDKETEKSLSYVMFIDDIKEIRKLLIKSLEETLAIQSNLEKKFAKERDFFSEQLERAKQEIVGLKDKIVQVQRDLDYESAYSM